MDVIDYIAILLLITFIVDVAAAVKFDSIAQMKGHKGYFWWCFWLGIIGCAMVIALPDWGPLQNAAGTYENTGSNDTLPKL